MERPLEYRRLTAPREDRGVLVNPAGEDPAQLVAQNRALHDDAWQNYDFQGRTLGQLASDARHELLTTALKYTKAYRDFDESSLSAEQPLLLAGHQPQLFHPGVWSKNFALAYLAKRQGGTAINLLIDSDMVKQTSVRVPTGSVARPRMEAVSFDVPPEVGVPYEEDAIRDIERFSQFGARATVTISSLVPDPLLKDYWPRAVERAHATGNLGMSLSQSRHQLEGDWGLSTLEVPQSAVCQLESFHYFAAHLLAHLPRLSEVYNQSVAEYRLVHKIRGTAHPVPDLSCDRSTSDGPWLEAPFWIWTSADPRRRHLFARQQNDQIILSDRQGWEVALDLTAEGEVHRAAEQLAALNSQGVKIRTRALLTTLFARLILGELFVHGIGGAKYDILTDALVRRFFGLEPSSYLTISTTLRLPIDRPQVSIEDLRENERLQRDVIYHPETLLGESRGKGDAAIEKIVATKRQWIHTAQTWENSKARHQAIAEANAALQPYVDSQRLQLENEHRQLSESLRNEAILGSREVPFCLHSETNLREYLLDYLPGCL